MDPSIRPLRFGPAGRFELRPAEYQLLVDGRAAVVGGRALDLLIALAARPGQLLTKSELLDIVWPGLVVEENNLRVQVNALRRLQVGPASFSLEAGTSVSITGKSGSGKSLLLRMIADLDPHEGDATLDGHACSRMPAPQWRRMVSYVAANAGWWEERVAAHFPVDTDLETLLPSLGIPAEAATWPIARLSTGERQRLALLRALGPANRVLLLDEPTSGLDATAEGSGSSRALSAS